MSRKQKKTLYRILVAAGLLVIVSLLPVKHPAVRLALYLAPYLTVGLSVLRKAARNIAHGQVFDEQFLMSIATLGAFVLGEYTEAVAVMLFYQVGELFQSIAVGKSRKSIAALMEIRPETATVIRDGKEQILSPEEVGKGEIVIVRPGEKIPLDGVITEGETMVDAAALTGESLPQQKTTGDRVVSGSVNVTGLIRIQTESLYQDSTVAKILELVENASSKKARTENFITRFAKYYTPCVVGAAMILALVPPLFAGDFAKWMERALIFLVVSCPCALVISVPLSFFGGIGGASKQGILIKGSQALERLAGLTVMAFDKTGTLTKGRFTVTKICPADGDEKELLRIAALAESRSNHPIARSVVQAYGKEIGPAAVESVTEHAGLGIEARINGKSVFAGNARLMEKAGVKPEKAEEIGTAVHIAANGCYMGYLIVADEIKEDSQSAIEALKNAGITKTVMLTGDKKEIAENVGKTLGIDEIRYELMPDEKVAAVETLMQNGAKLGFAGDGINDAPVLARADVSIAMGALGSDAAIEAADIVLMDDKLSGLVKGIGIAKKTMRIVRQNIVFALAVKGAVLLLGALGFANMWIAVFADVGVAVLAIFNAMRAMKVNG